MFITDLADDDDLAYLEALERGWGRAEKLICNLKDTGLTNLPSADMAINAAWMTTALIAHDLLAWTRLVALDGISPEPNRNGSATAFCTPPASSAAAGGAPGCPSPPTSRGPKTSSPPSTG